MTLGRHCVSIRITGRLERREKDFHETLGAFSDRKPAKNEKYIYHGLEVEPPILSLTLQALVRVKRECDIHAINGVR